MDSEFKSLVGYEEIEVNANGELRHVKNHKLCIKVYESETSHCCSAHWHRGANDFRTISMFKLMANLFVDNPNNYTIIKTIDGNNANYMPSNLKWVAHKTKESISDKQKEQIACKLCGCIITKHSLVRHQRSKACMLIKHA